MATTVFAARPSPPQQQDRPSTPPPQMTLTTSSAQQHHPHQNHNHNHGRVPVPNKHLPFCSPGPRPSSSSSSASRSSHHTPPPSPATPSQLVDTTTSLIHPVDGFDKIVHDPPVYAITAAKLHDCLEHLASQPLPSPRQVFPWLHGLHADNQTQLGFFAARKKTQRQTPKCIRGLTIVKTGGDLTRSKLKGAVGPDEILKPALAPEENGDDSPTFLDVDPRDGFSVRNFQIQACKLATVSDIVVYGDDETPQRDVIRLARRIALAQADWQRKMISPTRLFNTFVLTERFEKVEQSHPNLVAVDSDSLYSGHVMDFFYWERKEMCTMSAASEISQNVWLGPTPDPSLETELDGLYNQPDFDVYVEASDAAQMPNDDAFEHLEQRLEQADRSSRAEEDDEEVIHQLLFPASGAILPPTWSYAEVDGLLKTCQWMYKLTHLSTKQNKRRDSKLSLTSGIDDDGDTEMESGNIRYPTSRKILIHCADGYTETSLLALAYYMFAECVPAHEAWLQLHRKQQRNFFAYNTDVQLLQNIQPRLMQASPKHSGEIRDLLPIVPDWMSRMDGSLPSRIMPYMYLGNLGHANNPGLLRELGIGQILSIGEAISWPQEVLSSWSKNAILYVDRILDNGVDPLAEEFGRCLEFIENGRKIGTATLVHCRVGVSRSATICIAEVMNELGLSFPRAYCFVRARRLNVIIQPHLRFSYELLKWEEFQCQRRGKPLRRELEWATIAREIAALNRPYARQN